MKGDEAVETGAEKLEALADKAAAKGGVGAKLADELADDAALPAQAEAVAHGRGEPRASCPRTPSRDTGGRRAGAVRPAAQPAEVGASAGPNPFVVAGAAFAAGTVLAKVIDWRGHAHPRR